MERSQWSACFVYCLWGLVWATSNLSAQDSIEFFESRIRPILVEHCYECHNSVDSAEGQLSLDSRAGIRTKSASGVAVVPGEPEKSLLLQVIRHEVDGMEMPAGSEKLSPEVIADFTEWIRNGASDPRVDPPSKEELQSQVSWDAKLDKRKKWWSLQPITSPQPPPENEWSTHPIDRFVYHGLQTAGLSPAAPASRHQLIRRLSYTLTGLPPTAKEIRQFESDSSQDAFSKLVDRYLQSPHFGEKWARHWMDWVRYADSHGSEGDPAIPYAYRYRDYLIRALNTDVPADQLIREHLAGDLLDSPRTNRELKINESAIGPAHLRFVFHGFAPTDALQEKVRFTDDQINVFSKAFLGLTVSCARCHDHKFDAISQRDYYALFGIFGSSLPAMNDVNLGDQQTARQSDLASLKQQIRSSLAEVWLAGNQNRLSAWNRILSDRDVSTNEDSTAKSNLIRPWRLLKESLATGATFDEAWSKTLVALGEANGSTGRETRKKPTARSWDLGTPGDVARWFPAGNGLSHLPANAGDFVIGLQGDQIVEHILPAGIYSHLLSTKHRGVLNSPRFSVKPGDQVYVQLIGGGQASLRHVVQNYPRNGTVFPIHRINRPDWYWHRLDLDYWAGDDVHLEVATAKDAPLVIADQDRSWFGIRQVRIQSSDEAAPTMDDLESLRPLLREIASSKPESEQEILQCYVATLNQALAAWKDNQITDAQALFLNRCLAAGVLRNDLEQDPALKSLVTAYRDSENRIPLPTRVPGVTETISRDQPLFHRGDHHQPRDPVPRRFLEAIDATRFETRLSGRLELADAVVSESNPLTARVMANRIWLHLFGEGIVSTPDNFGKLGHLPSHPQLLDYLASRFRDEGWSFKDLIRFIVHSKTWQQSSRMSAEAENLDPNNRWWSHFNIRRLDAEAVRDSMLWASGELNLEMFGPTVDANSDSVRRSIYLRSMRNSMNAFLTTFDAPVPFSTVGRRHQTNVPAQSLALMNGEFTMARAVVLGRQVANETGMDDRQRVQTLFQRILGRKGDRTELASMQQFLETARQTSQDRLAQRQDLERQSENLQRQVNALIDPVKKSLLNQAPDTSPPSLPTPIAHWQFTEGLDDLIGNLDVELIGSARITTDGLRLDGGGFAKTKPLRQDLREKTLEVWLRLDELDQRGGGAMTVQDLQGHQFDSIVYSEQTPRKWMAGSDFFKRTSAFSGAPDESASGTIQIAIVYEADGTVRGYRNGRGYGDPYRTGQAINYRAGDSQVVFGMRHGVQVSSGRMLQGHLLQARLYDFALTPADIAASFSGQPFVARDEILAAMLPESRETLERLEFQQAELESRLQELQQFDASLPPFAQVAHILFNTKEFIYLR